MSRSQFGCGYCKFWCDTNEEYELHFLSKQHLEYISRWFCSSCNIQLYSANEWDKHLTTSKHKTNSNTMLSCDLCKYTTMDNQALRRHNLSKKHLNNVNGVVKPDTFTCDTCKYTCGNLIIMKQHNLTQKHIRQVQGVVKPDKFTCNTCKYETINKDNLERHLLSKTHQDAEKGIFKVKLAEYTCEACNYKTPFKQSLHTHTLSKKHQKRVVESTTHAPVVI